MNATEFDRLKQEIESSFDVSDIISKMAPEFLSKLDNQFTKEQIEQLHPIFVEFANNVSRDAVLLTFVTLSQQGLIDIRF